MTVGKLAPPLSMFVTDRRRCESGGSDAGAGLVAAAGRAAAAGVTLVQVRERGLDDRALVSLVRSIVAAVADAGTRVVVNERADIALASGAAGVHLPADGIAASRMRAMVPEGFLIGRSLHSVAEARAVAQSGGCDYLVFGTVFSTTSKPTAGPAAGIEQLAAVCREVDLPVLAIGGITADHFREVVGAGAAGIAAITMFIDTTGARLARDLARLQKAFAASA